MDASEHVADQRSAGARSGRARVAEAALISAGVVTCLVVATLFFIGYLSAVDPRDPSRILPADPSGSAWLLAATAIGAGMAAAAGLPSQRRSKAATPGAAGQCAAGAALLLGTAIGTAAGMTWLFGPEDRCAAALCWPMHAQALAAAAPGVLAALSLFVAAVRVRRSGWLTRTLTPVLTWLVSVTLLRWAWEPLLLPVFQGPPPWL